jgi:hypothetical protein
MDDIKNNKNKGKKGIINHIFFWANMISLIFKEPIIPINSNY